MEYSDIFEAIETKSDDTPSTTLKAINNGDDVNLKNEHGENFLHIIANIYKTNKLLDLWDQANQRL
jgi:hypothetical protein